MNINFLALIRFICYSFYILFINIFTMAATATQDDDLLIIADDTSESDTWDIDFSFDFWDETDEVTTQEAKTEQTHEATTELEPEQTEVWETDTVDSEEGFDLGIDLSQDSEVSVENNEEVSEVEEVSFDLGLTDEASAEIAGEEDVSLSGSSAWGAWSTGDDSSMNDILSATIAKLTARQTNIASQKDGKLKHEDEIKMQIQTLQNEHSTIEQELAGLDSESAKITANITELENMKLDPVKEHNAKRVAKKK